MSRILRFAVSAALMALAANCFLKYLWWTACYIAWQGIPKLANQWRAAGTRASFNGWAVIVLEFASVAVLFTVLRGRSSSTSGFLTTVPRLVLSCVITIALTALFALALAWIRQGPLAPLTTSVPVLRSAKIPPEASWANFFSV